MGKEYTVYNQECKFKTVQAASEEEAIEIAMEGGWSDDTIVGYNDSLEKIWAEKEDDDE